MSSLSELKREVEEVTDLLAGKAGVQAGLEAQLEEARDDVQVVSKHLSKLKRALDILEGNAPATVIQVSPATESAPVAPAAVSPTAPVAPSRPRVIKGPSCSACNEEMFYVSKTMRSGALRQCYVCPSCNNEAG